MLARHTNDRLKSTIHRVVNPPREKMNYFAAILFLSSCTHVPKWTLAACKECIDAEHPKQYEISTAGEFLNQRLPKLA